MTTEAIKAGYPLHHNGTDVNIKQLREMSTRELEKLFSESELKEMKDVGIGREDKKFHSLAVLKSLTSGNERMKAASALLTALDNHERVDPSNPTFELNYTLTQLIVIQRVNDYEKLLEGTEFAEMRLALAKEK